MDDAHANLEAERRQLDTERQQRKKIKEKSEPLSRDDGSLLRQQPAATNSKDKWLCRLHSNRDHIRCQAL